MKEQASAKRNKKNHKHHISSASSASWFLAFNLSVRPLTDQKGAPPDTTMRTRWPPFINQHSSFINQKLFIHHSSLITHQSKGCLALQKQLFALMWSQVADSGWFMP
ncbi:hypothetical protein [Gaoshiqia sediminis]|uniref:Uncharacterized protein n=1 Tax=Gaoshiqia sediminis TaxID=2986998 RepID=A0AA41Y7S0_9BACT|nr:hypothetical protein [Gaoshiqia sediminis]MCW0484964.1 hypothetical protein [Gaoshiqia sediminis]